MDGDQFSARAWRPGEDTKLLAGRLTRAHDQFVSTGAVASSVRPLVAQSWQRSLSTGLDPEGSLPPVELVDDELEQSRLMSPLAPVMPIIRRLLVEHAAEAGLLVAVSDPTGRLLWVEGSAQVRRRAQRIHFVEGASWSECQAGTNAPGTALALDQPVQIFAAEHLARQVTPWSCTASPIHDPHTGAILGALDLTGGEEVAAPHTLALVRATVAAVETELELRRARAEEHGPWRRTPGVEGWLLRLLGCPTGVLERPVGAQRLSLRHSELLTILSVHPEGISGERLAAALYDHRAVDVSLRAELSRLRPLVAPLELSSRPYRLSMPVRTDIDAVRDLLAAGRLTAAVDSYRGPLLPRSDAPGIVLLRHTVHEELRSAVVASRDLDALLRFGSSEPGLLDWQVWNRALEATPPSSPRRTYVEQRVAAIDRELGSRRRYR